MQGQDFMNYFHIHLQKQTNIVLLLKSSLFFLCCRQNFTVFIMLIISVLVFNIQAVLCHSSAGNSTSQCGRSTSRHPHNFPEGQRLLHSSNKPHHHSREVKQRAHTHSATSDLKTQATSLLAHHSRPSEVKEKRANENSNKRLDVC